jgi:hypothetical protein
MVAEQAPSDWMDVEDNIMRHSWCNSLYGASSMQGGNQKQEMG